MGFRHKRLAIVAAVTLTAATVTLGTAMADDTDERTGHRAPDLSVDDVKAHLDELQAIAEANGGNRAHGTPGYQASLDYVKEQVDAVGFETRIQEFEFGGKKSYNLIADWPKGGEDGEVLMTGAHLDSVDTSPGINDDGTGVAAVLQTALTVAEQDLEPKKHLRFAWWGTEEETFIGSTHYVDTLPAEELKQISAYLNYDMIGSPNAGYFVYDQSPQIAEHYLKFFAKRDIPTEPATALDGRSDHEPFLAKGVPVGGIFTGSAEVKTQEQADKWGGTVGEPMDPCYHQPCDTPDNIDYDVLDVNSDAVAAMVWKFGV